MVVKLHQDFAYMDRRAEDLTFSAWWLEQELSARLIMQTKLAQLSSIYSQKQSDNLLQE